MKTIDDNSLICVLGATGTIGIELTAHLLKNETPVLAVVRTKSKLEKKLKERGIAADVPHLKIKEADFFNEGSENTELWSEILASSKIFNCATPKISYRPFSKANRNWGTPVLDLTKHIITLAQKEGKTPHHISFIGPEKFKQVDGKAGPLWGGLSKIVRGMIKGLDDKYKEATYLLESDYKNWTILRCGEIRPGDGQEGDASKVDMDLLKDKSNYRKGKGKSLIGEDLGSFIANLVQSGKIDTLTGKLPFLFNTKF